MKNIRENFDDSLRPEYRRADFGEVVKGKHATTQVEFAELVRLLLACIGEDEGINFTQHQPGSYSAREPGDWTFEIDNGNQITLRYWLGEFGNIEELISDLPGVTTSQERSNLLNLLLEHVRTLKAKVHT